MFALLKALDLPGLSLQVYTYTHVYLYAYCDVTIFVHHSRSVCGEFCVLPARRTSVRYLFISNFFLLLLLRTYFF